MFRDILVVLGVKGIATSYALSFARHFDAEFMAVWPAQYPFETIGDAQTRYDLVAAAKEQAEEESAARTLEFVEQAHHFGVKAHTITNDFKRGEPRNLPHLARGFDLIVVEQPTPERHAFAGVRSDPWSRDAGAPCWRRPTFRRIRHHSTKSSSLGTRARPPRAPWEMPFRSEARQIGRDRHRREWHARPQFAGWRRCRSASRTPWNSCSVQGDTRRNWRRRYATFVCRGQRRQNDGHRRLWPFARCRDAGGRRHPHAVGFHDDPLVDVSLRRAERRERSKRATRICAPSRRAPAGHRGLLR